MKNLKLHGRIVEFGCNNSITNSNTYPLEKVGWEGLCIEPNPINYEKAKKERKHAVNAIIAPEQNYTYAILTGDCNQLSGIKEFYSKEYMSLYEKCKTDGNKLQQDAKLVGKPLEKILEEHGMETVTYICTDCEGCQWQFIENFDFTKYDEQICNYEMNTVARRYTKEIDAALAKHRFVESRFKGGDHIFTRPIKFKN